jgi:hypothetical protein
VTLWAGLPGLSETLIFRVWLLEKGPGSQAGNAFWGVKHSMLLLDLRAAEIKFAEEKKEF